jgi:hypothetical protein
MTAVQEIAAPTIVFDGECMDFAMEVYGLLKERAYVVHVIPRQQLEQEESAALSIERDRLRRQFQDAGGRGVELAERIDVIDRRLEVERMPFDGVISDVYRGEDGFVKVAIAQFFEEEDTSEFVRQTTPVEFDVADDLAAIVPRY